MTIGLGYDFYESFGCVVMIFDRLCLFGKRERHFHLTLISRLVQS